jgi:Putative enzyme of poly-gamma-glutamate biosynthesis (capsule formation)
LRPNHSENDSRRDQIFATPAKTARNEIIEKEETVKIAPVTLLAFGDLLLDRYIKREIDRKGADYPFENIKDFLAGNDLVLANLEGSFTDFKPRKLDPNNTSFTFDPKLAPMLKECGFNIVNLANNHVQDFGKDGFSQSEAYLDKAGISHFGDFYNEGPAVIKNIDGLKIAFIGYNEFGNPAIAGTVAKIKEIEGQCGLCDCLRPLGRGIPDKFLAGFPS